MHDPAIGRPVADIVTALGGVPFYSDRFDRKESFRRAGDIAPYKQKNPAFRYVQDKFRRRFIKF
jgi:hypothetical protein